MCSEKATTRRGDADAERDHVVDGADTEDTNQATAVLGVGTQRVKRMLCSCLLPWWGWVGTSGSPPGIHLYLPPWTRPCWVHLPPRRMKVIRAYTNHMPPPVSSMTGTRRIQNVCNVFSYILYTFYSCCWVSEGFSEYPGAPGHPWELTMTTAYKHRGLLCRIAWVNQCEPDRDILDEK